MLCSPLQGSGDREEEDDPGDRDYSLLPAPSNVGEWRVRVEREGELEGEGGGWRVRMEHAGGGGSVRVEREGGD